MPWPIRFGPRPSDKKKVIILGGGPNRIGQGIEFDYCCVHAAMALKEEGLSLRDRSGRAEDEASVRAVSHDCDLALLEVTEPTDPARGATHRSSSRRADQERFDTVDAVVKT